MWPVPYIELSKKVESSIWHDTTWNSSRTRNRWKRPIANASCTGSRVIFQFENVDQCYLHWSALNGNLFRPRHDRASCLVFDKSFGFCHPSLDENRPNSQLYTSERTTSVVSKFRSFRSRPLPLISPCERQIHLRGKNRTVWLTRSRMAFLLNLTLFPPGFCRTRSVDPRWQSPFR